MNGKLTHLFLFIIIEFLPIIYMNKLMKVRMNGMIEPAHVGKLFSQFFRHQKPATVRTATKR